MKRYFIYDAGATEGAGGDTATIIKSINELGEKHSKQVEGVKSDLTRSVNEVKESADKQVAELKQTTDNIVVKLDEVEKTQKELLKKNGKLKLNGEPQETKTFNQIIGETIEENLKEIQGSRGLGEKRYRLKGFEDTSIETVKAVGDMSTANFVGNESYVTDFRRNIIPQPFNNVYLSDVIPNETSASGSAVLYPKENGGEGGAASWTDPTEDKAQMDFDLTTYSAYYKWGAGYVIVAREMLDDIPFMTAYIQQRMLRSLKKWESAFILDGTSDTNPAQGLNDVATAYDGAFTDSIGMIIDAAYGQIPEDTFNDYTGTTVVMQPRRTIEIGLNQASGSGEYNLPQNSIAFANGRLTLGGLQTVTTMEAGAQDFYAFDRSALVFIRRMQPELIQIVDSVLAKKNKIMFRIEERAGIVCFNNAAVVKGTLPTFGA